jgi:hypothetical protein
MSATLTGAATRPKRGRARVKVDLSRESHWRVADLEPLFGQLGLPTDVQLGRDFPGILTGRPAYIDPYRMTYAEGRLRLTLPELYAVQHGHARDQLTGTVERLWLDRLRFDAGRLRLDRVARVHRCWHAAKAAELTEGQRRVLDAVVLLDGLRRRAEWMPEQDHPEDAGMMLAERFLGSWASEPRPDRWVSPATARRRRNELSALGLLVEVPPPAHREPTGPMRAARYFRLAVTDTEIL